MRNPVRPALALVATLACAATLTTAAHAATVGSRTEPVRVQVNDPNDDVWITKAPAGDSVTDAEKWSVELTSARVAVNSDHTRLSVTLHTYGVVGASDRPTYYGMFVTSRVRDLLVGSTHDGETVLLDIESGKALPCRNASGAATADDTYRVTVPVACLERAGVTRGRVKAYAFIERNDGVDLATDFTARTPRISFLG